MQHHDKHLWSLSKYCSRQSWLRQISDSCYSLIFLITISPFEHLLCIKYNEIFRHEINFTQNTYVPLQNQVFFFHSDSGLYNTTSKFFIIQIKMPQFFTIVLPYKVWKVNIAIPWTHDDGFYSKTDRNYSQITVIMKSYVIEGEWKEKGWVTQQSQIRIKWQLQPHYAGWFGRIISC